MEIDRLNLYPDPEGRALREKLADHYGVELENVFLANGSDDLPVGALGLAMTMFLPMPK